MFIEIGRRRWPDYEWGHLIQAVKFTTDFLWFKSYNKGWSRWTWKPQIRCVKSDWRFDNDIIRTTQYFSIAFLCFFFVYLTYDQDRH